MPDDKKIVVLFNRFTIHSTPPPPPPTPPMPTILMAKIHYAWQKFFVDAPLFDRGAYKTFQILFFWKNVLKHNWNIYKNWEDVSRIVLSNSFHIDEMHERKDKYKYFDLKFDSAKEFFIFYF